MAPGSFRFPNTLPGWKHARLARIVSTSSVCATEKAARFYRVQPLRRGVAQMDGGPSNQGIELSSVCQTTLVTFPIESRSS